MKMNNQFVLNANQNGRDLFGNPLLNNIMNNGNNQQQKNEQMNMNNNNFMFSMM